MIEKLISIKNIGRFRNCTPQGDVSFRKLNLLFAENGRGKTTLCAILRSLQTGQSLLISERKTLGTTDVAYVQIRLGGNNFRFEKNAWSATYPDIAVFDSVFVHDNVYAGDYVDHEHKKNLYRVIVGAHGVQLAKEIEDLDSKIRDANNDIRTKKEAVSRTVPNGVALEDYLLWQPDADIESKIKQKYGEITKSQQTQENATEIQSKALLSKISLPDFPSDFLPILAKQLADVTADAESRVRQQIADHNMGFHGETWLSQGLSFVASEKCPFCGQCISGNELISFYLSHFNLSYKNLKQEVAQLTQRVINSIGESALNPAQATLSNNLTLIEFWKRFTEVPLPFFAFEDARTKYTKLLDLAKALAARKQQAPTEPIMPGNDFRAALNEVTNLRQSAESYNATVDGLNTLIKKQKTAAHQGSAIDTLKKELDDLEAKKKRFKPKVIWACREYQDALAAKDALEQQKSTTREHLDQYCRQIIKTYENSINTYLDHFNAGFRITNSRHQYTGGTPSSQYQIQINNCAVSLGDSRTQPGTPCFKTTLSSGDRSALALAFFLAAMNQDTDIENKIVVLDDPFTSQDRFRRTCTQQLIRQLSSDAKQVIVLSHDPYFLRLIWENYSASDIKCLQLYKTCDNTFIVEWDLEAETQSSYMKYYSLLLDFYRDRKGTPLEVARSIRPFVEGLYRVRFPGHFQQGEWLGNFIDKIRTATETDGLFYAKADLFEIEAINDYSKKYHHEQNPNTNSETISDDELHGFVKRTLRLVGGG